MNPSLKALKRATIIAGFLAAFVTSPQNGSAQNRWSVTSPNNKILVAVELDEQAGKGSLSYRVEYGAEGSRTAVLANSQLGLTLRGQSFTEKLKGEAVGQIKRIDEAYKMPHGKRADCRNSCNQLTLNFRNEAGAKMEMDFRAYDDGVAFRYRLPGAPGSVETVQAEATRFTLPNGALTWMHPIDKASTYSPAYETYYENEIRPGTSSPLGFGWAFPVLFRTADASHWALITEANVGTNYCASHLSNATENGSFGISLPNPGEGNGTGSVEPSSTLPWEMPWRVLIIGNSLGTIVESTLVNDVSSPSQLQDTSWVRPGRVGWSWWSDNPSPQDAQKQKKFVDLAAKMGWEYILVDANWTIIDNGSIHDVLRYAKRKGVGVLLWYNSGGPHNLVTEKPRDCFTYRDVRRFEFDLLRKWGVKGVKVDFFQSDKQNVIDLYHGIMRDAADYQIMVNFHGCTLPRGWSRTWPHLVSMEAIRGEECYIFSPEFPEKAPVQNTISPFTRNVVGPMDYTPVAFSDNKYPHRTTSAHELALSVVFESGWLHFADKADAYLSLPSAPREFLKNVPVSWDDTRFVAGYPGQFVILARRKGDRWYLAGVNGQNKALEQTFKLGSWAGAGRYQLNRIADGASARKFADSKQELASGQEITVKMLPYGGFVATLAPMK